MMRRTAFTMVELVFVIVILGILAAVAIPKLSATRNDAKVSKLAHMVMTGTHEIAMYAVSSNETNNSFAVMSNSFATLEDLGDANLSNKKAVIKAGSVNDCLTIEVNTTQTSEILRIIKKPNVQNDIECSSVQSLINEQEYPMELRGVKIAY